MLLNSDDVHVFMTTVHSYCMYRHKNTLPMDCICVSYNVFGIRFNLDKLDINIDNSNFLWLLKTMYCSLALEKIEFAFIFQTNVVSNYMYCTNDSAQC